MPSADATKKEKAAGGEREREKEVENERERESDLTEDLIDMTTFEQILEMDDDEDEREFSRAIVIGFMDQAEQTFSQMESHLEAKDLQELSSLGHFLKGSSATLGLTKVKDYCEKIQNLGNKKDETGIFDLVDESLCLTKINTALKGLKGEYQSAKTCLKNFYGEL